MTKYNPYIDNWSNRLVEVDTFKLNPEAIVPTRNGKHDAGIDIYALEDTFIPIGKTVRVKTGIALNVPMGFVGKIEDRSSMALNGLRTGGGVVDHGYNGELGIVIHNLTNTDDLYDLSKTHNMGYRIKRGDKIAQLLLYKVETPEVVETKEMWNSERGSNGFGSSGR